MRLRAKLTLLALAVSALPVALAGYQSLSIGQRALRGALEQNELTVAKQVAGYAASHVDNMLSMLRVDARILDLTRSAQNEPPSPQALNQVLWLVYHQNDDFCAVAMFDEHGALIGKPASLEDPGRYDSLKSHEPMRPTDVEGVGLMAPLGAALSSGQGIGPIFLGGPLRLPHVVLAVAFDPSYGGGKRILAAEVSLKRLANYVASLSTPDIDVKLLDGRGRLFAAGSMPRVDKLEPQRLPGAREGELPPAETVAEYVNGNRHLIGAYAPVTPWGLGAVVDRTVSDALKPVDKIAGATLVWMLAAILVGSLGAFLFARRVSDRVAVLAAGSKQIAAGNLETRIAQDGRDELASLATSFNQMASALDAARKKITQQTNEIMAWNQTLEKRVEEKTGELRQAQDLLLRSRSLSALGELGAGVAHEINNPLTGALGIVQLLLADMPGGHPAIPLLQDLEREALRIRKIVHNMLRLAQRQSGTDTTVVELSRALDDAIELCGPSELSGAGIEVIRKYEPAPPVRASATQLEEAFIQLIQNARAAMVGQRGGKLTLEIKGVENRLVRVTVADTGGGISSENLPRIFDPFFTTKSSDRAGSGLGLSFVHRIVEDNGGTIQVESTQGAGTKFVLTFPGDAGKAHRA
ncbi:MAG TPA: ATP-binding protein [Polyangia bacterium]|nr:ATP-binding protein [Polyangia bacterium]